MSADPLSATHGFIQGERPLFEPPVEEDTGVEATRNLEDEGGTVRPNLKSVILENDRANS